MILFRWGRLLSIQVFLDYLPSGIGAFLRCSWRFTCLWTHPFLRRHQWVPGHAQVRQRKQRFELQRVFLQTPVAHFHKSELALDHTKRVLDLGPDARLELFDLVDEHIKRIVCLVELLALAQAHGHLPAHAGLGIGPLVGALIAGIGKHNGFLAMQQTIAFGDIGRMAGGAAHGMHQPGGGIHADVRLHPEVPLIALFARMHLRVALAVFVLGGTGRGNERRVHRAALPEQQALTGQHIIDSRQNALGQLVLLQPMAKPQDGALVRQASIPIELGKLAVQRHVEKGFFHRRVRQAEPLLKEVNAQHRLQGKGRSAVATLGVVRRDKRDQRGPGNKALHLL